MELRKVLKEMVSQKHNLTCADCDEKRPRWASINLGVFVCVNCSGAHRKMGTHISQVRSIDLDDWQPAWVEQMKEFKNNKVSSFVWCQYLLLRLLVFIYP